MTCKDRERTEAHEEMEAMRKTKGEWEREKEGGRGGEEGMGWSGEEGGREGGGDEEGVLITMNVSHHQKLKRAVTEREP